MRCLLTVLMSTDSKTAQALLAKLRKTGEKGCTRASLIGKGKVLEKQVALQELEKDGRVIAKAGGGIAFLFVAEHAPVPAGEALAGRVRRVSEEKGAVLWKEADLVKVLATFKHYTLAERTAAAKALCGGGEMLEVKDGKTTKYLHRSAFWAGGGTAADGGYFVSEPARLIFALVELEGEGRQRALGVTQSHYRDAELARQWRNRIAMQIHPDVCRHPKAQDAADELAVMFKEMTS